jgi:hypothetical protein
MTPAQISALQERIGTTPDGFWGPKSIAACQAHLRALMPRDNPWPATYQASLTAFYGAPGDESRLVNLPVHDLPVYYDGIRCKTIRCNAKVATTLRAILEDIAAGPHSLFLAHYAGCYNNRVMRGGSTPSLHARGAAIDLWPDNNGNHAHWPTAATMPLDIMEAFARRGWLSAGAFWSRDAMHFQATR